MVVKIFFGGGRGVNKVHYGLCESTFSSPEPLGLICNRPRDQETTSSGDENGESSE